MGIFKKIFKGVGKVFKKIGRGVKKVFKKFGKFMGKLGIAGQLAMMFVLPGIGAAMMRGFGALWTGVVGQTAAQATAAANAATAVAGNTATQAAIAGAADVAAGEVIKQTALKAATKTAMSAIRAGGAITQKATGMLASEYAIVKGAGMVLQKGAQFASTIQAGYKTVSQAVTGAFTETGKWIGGKLGMKTAEGAAMQGSWANYSKGVTDSFAKLGDKAAEFWSPIKAGPATASPITDAIANKAVEAVSPTSNFIAEAAGTSSGIPTDISMPTADLKSQIATGAESTFTPPTGFDVTDPTNLKRSLLDKVMGGESFGEKVVNFKDDSIQYGLALPGNVAKQTITGEATNAFYDAVGLTGEQQVTEKPSLFGNYVPQFRSDLDLYAQTTSPDSSSSFLQFIAGNEETYGNYGVKEGQFGGVNAYQKYFARLENSGVPS